ncbi:uncharacterized protein LOC127565732 [Drosophila albomicans]|uniref:Uncharacterized protein LOC127565732 n=1 Tax=Drosophila albomicans TaxID=7291 RepID=A0A9C6WGG0_DROAB|nr:uncharacterized protein LOC127565732 [Drosophila albomicans]
MQKIGNLRLGALLIIILINSFTWGTIVRLSAIKCHSDDLKFCVVDKCEMKTLSRRLKEVHAVVKLLKIPVTNASIRAELLRGSLSLYNFEFDGCQYWVNKRRNPFVSAIYKLFNLYRYTNVNHSCPYSHDIVLNHMPFDTNLNTQVPLGNGNYDVVMYWFAYKVLRATITISMEVVN